MRWISPTYTYTPEGWKTDLAVAIDEDGLVADLGAVPAGASPMELDGLLVPGFVNAHCHLELSGLQGMIPEGTGMAGFVRRLMEARAGLNDEDAKVAIGHAMDAAHASGTVAIGDICNGSLSIEAKQDRPEVYTHSFIELLGLEGFRAVDTLRNL